MPSSNSQPSTSLNLLAPDGIIHVSFTQVLSGEQYLELLDVSKRAATVHSLQQSLLILGTQWGIGTVTKIISSKRTVAQV
jgi:hypothetical protein